MATVDEKHQLAYGSTVVTKPAPPQSQEQKSCHDIIFAAAFLACFVFTNFLTYMFGHDVLTAPDADDTINSAQEIIKSTGAKYEHAIHISSYIAVGAFLASGIWLGIMLVCGKMLIWLSVIACCTISVLSGFISASFLKHNNAFMYWWPAVAGSVFAALVLMYVCCIRNRIAFASANLQVACRAVLSYPVVLVIAVFNTFLQIVWTMVWTIGTYAAIYHGEYTGAADLDGDGDGDYSNFAKAIILIVMLVIFFWTTFVLRNIVSVTTSGTVSSWWHHSSNDRIPLTATRALFRACTLSFGSICFGSLIVSLIQTLQVILKGIQRALASQGNAVAACLLGCIECMVECIKKWVEYFNRFAYAYIGIYGYSFVGSGRRVWQLFASKGMTAVVNDSLIVSVLMCGKIAVGILGAAAGWGFVAYSDDGESLSKNMQQPEATLGLTGFLIGYSIADVIMSVIDGAVATVFVLFAEDPFSLKFSHPDSHEELHDTWKAIYPAEYVEATMDRGGYGAV